MRVKCYVTVHEHNRVKRYHIYKDAMEFEGVMTSAGGNLLSIVVVTVCYVVYKRCLTCQSHIHTSWLDCDTEKVKRAKRTHKKELICEALDEHLSKTIRQSSSLLINDGENQV